MSEFDNLVLKAEEQGRMEANIIINRVSMFPEHLRSILCVLYFRYRSYSELLDYIDELAKNNKEELLIKYMKSDSVYVIIEDYQKSI